MGRLAPSRWVGVGAGMTSGQDVDGGRAEGSNDGLAARVFVSYAHDDAEHEDRVQKFWLFLREQGIDARLDLPAMEVRQDWAEWMTQQVRDADRVLVIASPAYKRRAEGDARPDEGRGLQWEARLIRERIYADQKAGLQVVLPVVLPGCSAADLPMWLAPMSATHYMISEYTAAGAEQLLRVLDGQTREMAQLPGTPILPLGGRAPVPAGVARPMLRTEVLIEAGVDGDGQLASAVWLAGSLLCRRLAPMPTEVADVWGALELPALVAAERIGSAGRRLADVLLDDAARRLLAGLLDRLPPGDMVEVVLVADGSVLSLPVELLRLATDSGEVGPLALLAGVSVIRRLATPRQSPEDERAPDEAPPVAGLAGPLKVLAAVAAPDETKTRNAPLDVEAEMQAVLDAVSDVAGDPRAQVRILEVASPAAIQQALRHDAYHVLHLSAHGSAEAVELEDEDGAPVQVTAEQLMQELRHAGRPVPLIVLSSCSSGSVGSEAMAAGLVARGADRVIAMLAPVSDDYATTLARRLYSELAERSAVPVAQALARARRLAEQDRSREIGDRLPMPEYGVAMLLAAGGEGPLVDTSLPASPLPVMTVTPGGKSVRELPMGALIGRRAELRTTMGVLRHTPAAVRKFGAASGVQLTGIGGIGKTAVAGRVISRLRADGWLIAVHEGRWNPTALIIATARAIGETVPSGGDPAQVAALSQVRDLLADRDSDDGPKLAAVATLLTVCRLLVVFDDFEQNLTPGGHGFLDPVIDDVITDLAEAAQTGALLLTSR